MLASWEVGYVPIIAVVSLTATAIYATLLGFAKAFNMPNLERFAKSELAQVIATVLMTAFLLFFVGSALEVASSLIGGNIYCAGELYTFGGYEFDPSEGIVYENQPLNKAFELIKCKLRTRGKEVGEFIDSMFPQLTQTSPLPSLSGRAAELYMIYFLYYFSASVLGIPIYNGQFGLGGGWAGAAGGELLSVYGLVEQSRLLLMFAVNVLVAINSQYALVLYIQKTFLAIFLPLGILLRSFYFTRSIGALFISLALSLYFVYPVVYILLDPGFAPSSTSEEEPAPSSVSSLGCVNTMNSFATVMSSFASVQQQTAAVGESEGQASISDYSRFYLELLIHPLVSLSISLLVARYVMHLLGGDPYAFARFAAKVI